MSDRLNKVKLGLPYGVQTTSDKRYNREWKKFMDKLEYALECVIEEVDFNDMTFRVLFSNGKTKAIELWFAEIVVNLYERGE